MSARKNTYAVIMAGGIESRFWPMSKESRPKQFLDILGTGRSLIQMTFDRLSRLVPAENILVVTQERYRGSSRTPASVAQRKHIVRAVHAEHRAASPTPTIGLPTKQAVLRQRQLSSWRRRITSF